jgi:hypothetical protein
MRSLRSGNKLEPIGSARRMVSGTRQQANEAQARRSRRLSAELRLRCGAFHAAIAGLLIHSQDGRAVSTKVT